MSLSFFWILLAMAAYGLLHSILASRRAKDLACRLGGQAARRFYRLFFNLVGFLTLLPVLALAAWLPDAAIYNVPAPWRYLLLAGQALSLIGLLAAARQTDLWAFAGLSQLAGKDTSLCHPDARDMEGRLVTGGLYRYVRHPLYTCALLFIWLTPLMTWNALAFNLGASVYIWIGARLEERKLLAEFGPTYQRYRETTPMLLPRFG